ncbi:amino acid permease [Nakamurella sp. YIM 132087]|uniref:Amino acid permease n=1 Tax=Nakamurella alba TaxID=2665158 RepID=A0A7K1FTG4_9ACTN|nr:amino acid permease [Nakamurella alba]MTD17457.1 amino acid permease [Nakamurella alba]
MTGPARLSQQIWLRKSVQSTEAEEGHGGEGTPGLKRTIGTFQLTMFGVGATVGTGVFFILQDAVPDAGPSVIISFVLAGLVAGLAAFCYAELASAIPVSGSTYSYAYIALGEIIAMVVAGCLLLEYGVSTAAVSVGWSGYLNALLDNLFGFSIPDALSRAPIPVDGGETGIVNLPAMVLVLMCATLLVRGASESARLNAIMVVIKVGVLVMFVGIAFTAFNADNFTPFAPEGVTGITAAAGIIFFTFIGLDAISTAGEEVKNPQKTMPRAILLALTIVTTLYILVAVSGLGTQPAAEFGSAEQQDAGLAVILQNVTGSNVWATILAAGAVISIFSVTLVTLYGQTRILFAIGRDGLISERFAKVNPRTLTPTFNTWVVAIAIALVAGFVPSDYLWESTSIGTLGAFTIVSIGIIVLRRREPNLHRPFKVPGYPVTPIITIAACLYLIAGLRLVTILVFVGWILLVLLYYVIRGRRGSVLGKSLPSIIHEGRKLP